MSKCEVKSAATMNVLASGTSDTSVKLMAQIASQQSTCSAITTSAACGSSSPPAFDSPTQTGSPTDTSHASWKTSHSTRACAIVGFLGTILWK